MATEFYEQGKLTTTWQSQRKTLVDQLRKKGKDKIATYLEGFMPTKDSMFNEIEKLIYEKVEGAEELVEVFKKAIDDFNSIVSAAEEPAYDLVTYANDGTQKSGQALIIKSKDKPYDLDGIVDNIKSVAEILIEIKNCKSTTGIRQAESLLNAIQKTVNLGAGFCPLLGAVTSYFDKGFEAAQNALQIMKNTKIAEVISLPDELRVEFMECYPNIFTEDVREEIRILIRKEETRNQLVAIPYFKGENSNENKEVQSITLNGETYKISKEKSYTQSGMQIFDKMIRTFEASGNDAGSISIDWDADYTLTGGSSDDKLKGGDGASLSGGEGDDTIEAGDKSTLSGGKGNDTVIGGDNSTLVGKEGRDILNGGKNSFISGGKGKDILTGGDNSYLAGGKGYDTYFLKKGEIFDVDGKGKIDGIEGEFIETSYQSGVYTQGSLTYSNGAIIGNGYNIKVQLSEGKEELGIKLVKSEKTPPRVDPLVLDLDGDGVETTTLVNGVNFDFNSDGMKEKTGWAGKDDGFLVYDQNANGKIDNGNEMFKENQILKNGTLSEGGFQSLADYDSNGDGIINVADDIFSKLKVWQDKNSNGITDEGELTSISDIGIKEISLGYTETNTLQSSGQLLKRTGNYTLEDGTKKSIGELLFQSSIIASKEVTLELTDEIEGLPDISAFGGVFSLHQAIVRDSELLELVKSFSTKETRADKELLTKQIIDRWIGSTSEAVVGKIFGESYLQQVKNAGTAISTNIINTISYDLNRNIYNKLVIQTSFSDIDEKVNYSFDETTGKWSADLNGVREFIETEITANREKGLSLLEDFTSVFKSLNIENSNYEEFKSYFAGKYEEVKEIIVPDNLGYYFGSNSSETIDTTWRSDGVYISALNGDDTVNTGSFDDVINAGSGDDIVNSGEGNDTIYLEEGADTLSSAGGNDVINGGLGNDTIDAGYGEDIITGGQGNDTLRGGKDNDTYIFNKGDGQDTILDELYDTWYGRYNDAGSNDTLKFGTGITKENLWIKVVGSNLEVGIKEEGKLFSELSDKIVIKEWVNINKRIETFEFADGTKLNFKEYMQLQGTNADDSITWTEFALNIATGLGNDTINTGSFDDVINAGSGDDNVNSGEGKDIIDGGDGDDTIATGDGTIRAGVIASSGLSDDILIGGKGNDTLRGGKDNDTYIFNKGDGQDTILDELYDTWYGRYNDAGSNDTLKFGTGITKENLWIKVVGSNLEVGIKEEGRQFSELSDKIVIKEWVNINKRIETFEFADGTKFDMNNLILTSTANDTITGNEKNNIIFSNEGNDTIKGGLGNDFLYGGSGDDTYIFNSGDGIDTIIDESGNDKITTNINPLDLIFRKNQEDLEIIVSGTADKIMVKNYKTAGNVEKIEVLNNQYILSSKIDELIQAMSVFGSQHEGISWETALKDNKDDVSLLVSGYYQTNI